MIEKSFGVAVIGGGPAGYTAALKAARLGAKTVLFEKDELGGTCLNRGCIPTKSFIKTAEEIYSVRDASKRGIMNDPGFTLDMKRVKACKGEAVKRLTGGVAALLRADGVTVVKGNAVLSGEHTISCGGEEYKADSIILCGGSAPSAPPIKGADGPRSLTSTELLDLEELPGRLAIIGGGVIGCEFASAFRAFGSEVTVVEALESLLPEFDKDLSAALLGEFKKQGIDVRLGKKIVSVENEEKESYLVLDGGEKIAADKILVCTGRRTDISALGALKDKIRIEGKGKISCDAEMRTNIPNIFAAGDVNGQMMLAHTAYKMGAVAAANALGAHEKCDLSSVPTCVYTIPQLASVGLTEEKALEKYGASEIAKGVFPFYANGRAVANGETEGFVKVIVLKKYSEILGVHIFGAGAAEMIAEAASLKACEITCEEAANIIHPHPSFSEAFMESCKEALGGSLNMPRKTRA